MLSRVSRHRRKMVIFIFCLMKLILVELKLVDLLYVMKHMMVISTLKTFLQLVFKLLMKISLKLEMKLTSIGKMMRAWTIQALVVVSPF